MRQLTSRICNAPAASAPSERRRASARAGGETGAQAPRYRLAEQARAQAGFVGKDKRMPAKSKKQQMAAGAALSAKRGETPKSKLKGASKGMVESMTETELHDMASAKRKDLPKQDHR